jgi:hypothetical protein
MILEVRYGYEALGWRVLTGSVTGAGTWMPYDGKGFGVLREEEAFDELFTQGVLQLKGQQ